MLWCACEDRSPGGLRDPPGGLPLAAGAQALAELVVFANQEVAVVALLVGEFEEDLFALGVFEPLAVALEELVRAALAADADAQRFQIVHTLLELLGARREQRARGALEEKERRPRFELRILLQERLVALLQRAEMLSFFPGQFLKHRAAAPILGHRGRAGVELETAALGRDGHPQRVAREHELGRRAVERRHLLAGSTFVADAMHL